jgi:DNA-binding response OmpR family regulator
VRTRRPRIVLVEDDPSIAEVLVLRLQAAGCDVHRYADGRAALDGVGASWPDLVVLDLGLPGGLDGMEVLRRLRRQHDVPVLILTARTEPRERVHGLEAGADDYVCKPFDTEEVLARIRALLRRSGHPTVECLTAGDLRIDRARYTVSVRGRDASLSPREVDLLFVLVQAQTRALTRGQILDRVWGMDAEVDPRIVDAYVTRLRRKLAEAGGDQAAVPWEIGTVWGVGYRFRLRLTEGPPP